jgi:sigma54-dependent transcription regulator
MSDWIERDGKKYYEEGYLILANQNTKRKDEELAEARRQLEEAWSEFRDLSMRGGSAVSDLQTQLAASQQRERELREGYIANAEFDLRALSEGKP